MTTEVCHARLEGQVYMIIPLTTLAAALVRYACPYSPAEETDAQRGQEISPETHSKEAFEQGIKQSVCQNLKVSLKRKKNTCNIFT